MHKHVLTELSARDAHAQSIEATSEFVPELFYR